MKKQSVRICLVLSCVLSLAGGCAKQGVVKTEEIVAPINPAANQSKSEQLKAEQSKSKGVKAEELKAASINSTSSDSKPSNKVSANEIIELEPIPNAGEIKADLETVYFDFDSYALSQDARNSLQKNFKILKNDPLISVSIEGNCDERGSDEYNLALGERRARSAMKYLVTMGIPEKRLSAISYGKEKPVAVGHDEASWVRNRRDDFVITK